MMTYQALHSERLYERIVEQIESQILASKLKLGEQLPPERDLAEQFGVSRTAVREAINTLRQRGLVAVEHGRGTFISNQTPQAARHSFDLMIKIGANDKSRGLVEVREMLEPEIAALAAKRAQKEQLDAARAAVAAMDHALHHPDRFIESDLDFHLALAEATHNSVFPILIDSIVDLLREQRKRIALSPGGLERGQFHHKKILRAVEQHDAASARTAMRAHLAQVRRDAQLETRHH
jgi:GntR family transcriptional regulator, transcriptional repressor for pyruvate dehydrogenase complex